MKNNRELINRIQSLVTKLSAKKTKIELSDATIEWFGELTQGTKIVALEGEIGTEIELEDGRKLTLNSENEVSEIITPQSSTETEVELEEQEVDGDEEPTPEPTPESNEVTTEDRINEMEIQVGELLRQMNEFQDKIETLENVIMEEKEKYEELSTQLTELAKAPAVPSKKESFSNSFNKTESRAAKVMAS